MKEPTIAAISTPLGPGGIGIIRISGPAAYSLVEAIFRPANNRGRRTIGSPLFESHRVYYGHIVDPQQGHVIDEALVIFMQSPNSFTREDVVEIQSHSGYVVLDRLLHVVLDNGARLADPGEFTKRAFFNGRIDLSQAEAVIDLINAPCEAAVQIANRQMAGGLRREIDAIITSLREIRARLEVELEFSEYDQSIDRNDEIINAVKQKAAAPLTKLIRAQKETAIYKEGLHLSIVGVPNVGKSSLLNQLVQKETAIVSEAPGTTRDLIREYVSINGIPVVVWDTAGLHESSDPVESVGIRKAHDQIDHSDMLLYLVDASRELTDDEQKLIETFKGKNTVFLINKIDLVDEATIQRLETKIDHPSVLAISAKTGQGLDAVKQRLFNGIVTAEQIIQSDQATPNLRQGKLLEKALAAVMHSIDAVRDHQPGDIVSDTLEKAVQALGAVTGAQKEDDLYDQIFDQFCIGK